MIEPSRWILITIVDEWQRVDNMKFPVTWKLD